MTWTTTTWGDVCNLNYGKALKDYKHFSAQFPVYGSGGLIGTVNEAIIPEDSVIVSRKGTLTAYWSSKPSHVIDTAFWLEPSINLDAKWSYYAIKDLDIATLVSGSGVPSLSRDDFYHEKLLLPPLAEQKAIAHILGVLDDKIENNLRMNKTLEEMARAIFKSWFVDFDPVRAKMEGRPTGLPDDISDLFPNELVDSEIGQIPKGWKVGEFKELCEIQNGYAFKGKDWNEHGTIPVVKIGNVKPMLVDLDNCSFIEENMVKSLGQFELNRGDILIGLTGYVGEVGLVPKRNIMPYLNQRVGKLVPHSSDDFSFIVTHTRRSEFKNNVENISTGSAQQNVSPRDIKLLKLTIPPTALRSKFHRLFHSFFEKILICDEETHTLAELRDTLLPKLISGEMRVENVEGV